MTESNIFTTQGVRVAVEGCGHGTLHAIYAAVERSSKERGWDGVDLLIIGGDFQAVRNAADLNVMSVPVKYRELGDFHEYYSGTRTAPYLTIFVAGNHEASSHLWELYHGGWVAPNIYYLGAANVVRLGPLRIAGMSGIWKGFDYRRPHHERLPFSQDDVKSFYHIREIDVRRLLQLRSQVDVGISHDWPRAIENHGDRRRLWSMKPDFESESRDGTLGNPAAEYAMDRLRPAYWFSAHMHCRFSAIKTYDPPSAADSKLELEPEPEPAVDAEQAPGAEQAQGTQPPESGETAANPDEIDLDLEGDTEPPVQSDESKAPDQPAPGGSSGVYQESKNNDTTTEDLRSQLPAGFARPQAKPKTVPGQPVPPGITNQTVRFLALDKCLPGRKFLQLCEIEPLDPSNYAQHPPAAPPATATGTETETETETETGTGTRTERYKLQYDPEWLAITRVFSKFLSIGDRSAQTPPDLGEEHYRPLIEAERAWVEEHVVQPGRLAVPENFSHTAPPHVPGQPESTPEQPDEYTNPQTEAFCALVGIENLWAASEEERMERKRNGPPPAEMGGGRGDGYRGGRGRGGGGGRGVGGGGGGRGGGWRGGGGGGRNNFGGRGRGRGRGRVW